MRNWQNQRVNFNHDWFVNKYLNGLDGFLTRLNQISTDSKINGRLIGFLDEQFHEWEGNRSKAKWIIDNFETEMSPKVLMESYPLIHWDKQNRELMGDLVHVLWKGRNPITKWIKDCEESYDKVEHIYNKINNQLTMTTPIKTTELISMKQLFREYRDTCELFSCKLSQLPGEILFV